MNHKMISLFKSILIIGWFLGVNLLVSILGGLVLGANDGLLGQYSYRLNLISQLICLLGVIWRSKKRLIDKRQEVEVLKTAQSWRYILWGVGAWVFCSLVNAVLLPFFPSYDQINNLFTDYEPILRFVSIVVVAPFLEEYLFRGKIQGYLKESFSAPIAIILQAVLFGSLHSLSLQKIYATIMGILFGIVKEREENFSSTFIMHMTINLIGWGIGSFLN